MKPESKTCKCGAVFERVGTANDLRWKRTVRCPGCRKRRPQKGGKEIPRHYEVTNPLIDKYLRGRA